MRLIPIIAATVALAAGPAFAQDTPPTHPATHHAHKKAHAAGGGERPVDLGPQTPDANKAYQGGGVVLQGAPGAPAPAPQATPPGQAPEGAVPH